MSKKFKGLGMDGDSTKLIQASVRKLFRCGMLR